MQERGERLAVRAPVQALERTVIEHAVDPPHLLVEDGVERAAIGQDLAHDAVAVLVRPPLPGMVRLRVPVRELPPLCGLHGDAAPGHALGLLGPVTFLAPVPIRLAQDGRNRAANLDSEMRPWSPLFIRRPDPDTILYCRR